MLAPEQQVSHLAALMEEHIRACKQDHSDVPSLELDLDRPAVVQWSEGVDDHRNKSTDELREILGFHDNHIPSISRRRDIDGNRDPWDEQNREWFQNQTNTIPFGPHWHQLVGVIKMLENAFRGLPVLLMDEVGLGKTLQIACLFATLVYFCVYYTLHRSFPGAFGTSQRSAQHPSYSKFSQGTSRCKESRATSSTHR
jgi:SNF2 family DNA or RNA helicase